MDWQSIAQFVPTTPPEEVVGHNRTMVKVSDYSNRGTNSIAEAAMFIIMKLYYRTLLGAQFNKLRVSSAWEGI